MALSLGRKKKAKSEKAASKKRSEIEKFTDAIDLQMRLASGEKVKKGRGLAKSWMEDGEKYGVESVLAPRVGTRLLYPKSAIVVDMKQRTPPTKELKELRSMADDGKLATQIYAATRKQKLADAAKKK